MSCNQALGSWQMPKDEGDLYSIVPHQPSPFDDFNCYSPLDWQCGFPVQESGADYLSYDPLCSFSSTDILSSFPNRSIVPENDIFYGEFDSTYETLNGLELNVIHPFPLLGYDETKDKDNGEVVESKKRKRRCKEENNDGNASKALSREIISQYFYMPITKAARELNVGLTLLKKRCRELGIRRWPHRKLMSLQTLIKNVQQDLSKEEGDTNDAKVRDAIHILEQEKKLMEEMPDMHLEDKTKKLRQACFKANYKKRKLMSMVEYPQSSSSSGAKNAYGSNTMKDDENAANESNLALLPASLSCSSSGFLF